MFMRSLVWFIQWAVNMYFSLQSATTEGKKRAYEEICDKFRPVFRHFFLEKFYSPPVWFERRLAYTRSVATNSIGKVSLQR